MVVCIKISGDYIVSVVEKLVEKSGIILVIYVSCGGSGRDIAIGDVKGGLVSSFLIIVSIWFWLGVVISVNVREWWM